MTATTHESSPMAEKANTLERINHLKPMADPSSLAWREVRRDAFWQQIPAWSEVDEATFLDHRWQDKNAITSPKKLVKAVQELVSPEFIEDVQRGFAAAPMAVRITPYILALIDWEAPYADPLRRQFLPLGSQLLPDHPMLTLDSLGEQADAPVPGLTHRYPDKALFLVLDTCPVYCRFCTRSYAVGADTEEVEKVQLRVNQERWDKAFQYMQERPELEDVVVSGGDAFRLKPEQLLEVGNRLLDIPHIRRFRFATKGPAILPMKLLTDHEWVDALTRIVDRGRELGKEVAVHTHFNHPLECTQEAFDAAAKLADAGCVLGNQMVLLRGVNDCASVVSELNQKLLMMRIRPYYMFQCDLAQGVSHFRVPLERGVEIVDALRGQTSGMAVPQFVVDLPGGRGKVALSPESVVEKSDDCWRIKAYNGEIVSVPSGPG